MRGAPTRPLPQAEQCNPWLGNQARASWDASEMQWANSFWAQIEWGSSPWSVASQSWQNDRYYGGYADSWQQPSWQGPWPFKTPHHKDIEKPKNYCCDITRWLKWSRSFTRFLRRQNWRWSRLLEKVQNLRAKPVTAADKNWWA